MSKGIMNRRDKMIWDNSALPTIDDVTGQISDLAESVAEDIQDAYDELDDKIDQAVTDCTYTAGTGINIDEDNVISSTLTADNGIEIKNNVIALTEDSYNAVNSLSYSTATKKSGKWIDNNDIFKITINVGTLPNASTTTVAHSISGIDKVIKWEAIAMGSTLYADFVDMITVDATNINIDTGSVDMSGYTGYVTVYYTLKKMFVKITPTEINRSLAQMNCTNDYKVELSNPNIECYLGIFKWPTSPNSNSIAILSRSTTSVTNALKLSEFDWSNLRGTIDVSLTSDYNGYKYTSYLVSPILSQNFKNNYVGIQVVFNTINDLLSAFYD